MPSSDKLVVGEFHSVCLMSLGEVHELVVFAKPKPTLRLGDYGRREYHTTYSTPNNLGYLITIPYSTNHLSNDVGNRESVEDGLDYFILTCGSAHTVELV
jgi:hypothetical protein